MGGRSESARPSFCYERVHIHAVADGDKMRPFAESSYALLRIALEPFVRGPSHAFLLCAFWCFCCCSCCESVGELSGEYDCICGTSADCVDGRGSATSYVAGWRVGLRRRSLLLRAVQL